MNITTLIILGILLSPFVAAKNSEFSIHANTLLEEMRDSYNINGEIKIKEAKINVGAAETRRYPLKKHAIILDSKKLQNATDSEMKGLLAHELAHLEFYSTISYPRFLVFAIRYLFSEEVRVKHENGADLIAIARGFGDELLAYREFRLKNTIGEEREFLEKYYFSPEKIREILDSRKET